eukprot:GHUV01030602.1.p2 GENE.GHUV01030602.1~~GHUV01030602.1.p2  ORF type:complete len:145 (+),score=16.87 GHUV01030602.1:182-616(+)
MHASHKAGVSGKAGCCGHSVLRCHAPRLPLRRAPGNTSGVRQVHAAALPSAFVGQLVSTGIIAVGAYLLSKQETTTEQDRFDSSSRTACPSCGGSGYEACMCTRWSDGDVGCKSCAQTGYTKCRSCGGNGKAVPRLVKVRKENI